MDSIHKDQPGRRRFCRFAPRYGKSRRYQIIQPQRSHALYYFPGRVFLPNQIAHRNFRKFQDRSSRSAVIHQYKTGHFLQNDEIGAVLSDQNVAHRLSSYSQPHQSAEIISVRKLRRSLLPQSPDDRQRIFPGNRGKMLRSAFTDQKSLRKKSADHPFRILVTAVKTVIQIFPRLQNSLRKASLPQIQKRTERNHIAIL